MLSSTPEIEPVIERVTRATGAAASWLTTRSWAKPTGSTTESSASNSPAIAPVTAMTYATNRLYCAFRDCPGRRCAGRTMTRRYRSIRPAGARRGRRSEEHTSELQSLMRISYAVFCLKKKKYSKHTQNYDKRCIARILKTKPTTRDDKLRIYRLTH